MVDHPNDDLFAHTSMTFGEHLEELRTSLFKAVLALAVGFVVGMLIGGWVVNRVQDPLKTALEKYYAEQAVEKIKERLQQRAAKGEPVPEVLQDEENVKRLVFKERMLFEEAYLAPAEVLAELQKKFPGTFSDVKLPTASPDPLSKDQMIRIFLWHTVEDDDRVRVVGLNPQEAFMIYMKAAFVTGAVISSPLVFYFLWTFVAAGLYPHEKRYIHIFLPFSLLLFLAGAAMAFFFVFPPVLEFFFSFNKWLGIDPDPRISEWLSFVLFMPLGFGISFQLPLVMLFLERIGIFSVATYIAKWRVAVLIISIAAMVLTPSADPYSMLLMFVPLTFLYFGGIWLCKAMPGQRNPFESPRVGHTP